MSSDTTRPDSTTKPDTLWTGASRITGTAPGGAEETLFRPGDTLLDTYRVVSEPVQGGMGSVWRVHHLHWNVDLAMKRPRSRAFQTKAQKDSFTQECSYWIRLGLHPNIVSCHYVRELEGVPTIFSEWVEGGSLMGHIRDGSVYDGTPAQVQARLLDLAIQFARGLHFAHEQGLIHQDVKPDNLLVTADWTAKVSDFGLARARSNLTALDGDWTEWDDSATLLLPSGGCTPAYCSPEQAMAQDLTRRTDLYSWAVSILELYLGRKPWAHGRTCTGPLAGLACRDYFAMCRETVPEALCELLESCLAQDPEDRPRDFSVVIERLKSIYQDVTGRPYPRVVPTAAVDSAAEYNNRALSFLDLVEYDTALALWDKGLKLFPGHPASVFNRTLARFRYELLSPWEVWEALEAVPEVAVRNRLQMTLDREISKTVSLPLPRKHPFDRLCDHSGDGRLVTAEELFYFRVEGAAEPDYGRVQAVYDLDRQNYVLALNAIDFLRAHDIPQTRRSAITLSRDGRFAAWDIERNRNGLDYPAGAWETHTVVADLSRLSHTRQWYLRHDAPEPVSIPDGPILREFERSGGRLSPDGTVIAFPALGESVSESSVSFYSVQTGTCLSRVPGAVLLGFTRTGSPVLYRAGQVCWGGSAKQPLPASGCSVPCEVSDWNAPSLFQQVNDSLALVKQRTQEGYGTGLLLNLDAGKLISPLRWRLGASCETDVPDAFQMTADGRWLLCLSPGVYRLEDGRWFYTVAVQVWDSAGGRPLGRFFPLQEKVTKTDRLTIALRNITEYVNKCLLTCCGDHTALRVLPEHRADYILSEITTTEDRLADAQRFDGLLQQARVAMRRGALHHALRLTDEARACPGFDIDPKALRLRASIGSKLQKRMVRQIIPLPQEPSTLLQTHCAPNRGPDWEQVAKSIERQAERDWYPDGYYNEVRVYVHPADYSKDGRYRLLNIMIAEDYTSPAQDDADYPEDTRHTLGVAVAEADTGRVLYRNKAMFRYDSHYTASFRTDFYHTELHSSGGELWLLSRGDGVQLRRVGQRDVFRVRKGRCQYAAFLNEERFLLLRADDWVWLYDLTGGGTLRQTYPGGHEDDAPEGAWNTDADIVDVPAKDSEGRVFPAKEYGEMALVNDNCFSIRHGTKNRLCWLDWTYEGEE